MLFVATGEENMDKDIAGLYGARIVHYRKAFLEGTGNKGDIAIISPLLQGDEDLIEVIRALRKRNARVILLSAGDTDLARKSVAYGVYDIINSPRVTLQEIRKLIENPRQYGDIDIEPDTEQKVDARPQEPEKQTPWHKRLFRKEKDSPQLTWEKGEKKKEKKFTLPWRRKKEAPQEYKPAWDSQMETEPQPSPADDGLHSRLQQAAGIDTDWKPEEFRKHFGLRERLQNTEPQRDAEEMKLDSAETKAPPEENWAFEEPAANSPETDPLTSLLRREALEKYTDYTAVVFCDLDNFKNVNDTHGHAMGDKILQEFARTVKRCVRETDPAIRYGGDEFVVLFKNLSEAQIAGRRIKTMWESNLLSRRFNVPVTVGFGEGKTTEEAVSVADREMYKRKHGGKEAAEPRLSIVVLKNPGDFSWESAAGRVVIDASFFLLENLSWQHDWRMGLNSRPLEINNTKFYGLSIEDMGEEIDQYDLERLERLLYSLMAEEKVVVCVSPETEKLLRSRLQKLASSF